MQIVDSAAAYSKRRTLGSEALVPPSFEARFVVGQKVGSADFFFLWKKEKKKKGESAQITRAQRERADYRFFCADAALQHASPFWYERSLPFRMAPAGSKREQRISASRLWSTQVAILSAVVRLRGTEPGDIYLPPAPRSHSLCFQLRRNIPLIRWQHKAQTVVAELDWISSPVLRNWTPLIWGSMLGLCPFSTLASSTRWSQSLDTHARILRFMYVWTCLSSVLKAPGSSQPAGWQCDVYFRSVTVMPFF